MKDAQIADGVREGMGEMDESAELKRLQEYMADRIEEYADYREELSLDFLVHDLIAKVRAYLIVDAELPENPYLATVASGSYTAYQNGKYYGYSEGQQSVVDAGFRKVREEK